ncbi:PGAP1-like alpha/beta domain-containing protein [Nocardioides mangrovicus]|uniref:PGAP1-like alpha/beta domain-containing protein n=1 Tax=Nocardioides mangrovicus TaxID=2478913 RepID=UPI0013148EED|nr:alpha/beta hydrolase [Nocardioides mangrovicus]
MSAQPSTTTATATAGASTRAGTLGALALGADLAHDAVLGTVREVHGAIGRRVHGREGRVAGLVYAGVGHGLRATSSALRSADRSLLRAGVGRPLEDSTGGRVALSALNGLFGDRIHERSPGLSISLAVRRGGRDVAPTSDGFAAAFPGATGEVVCFLHGLGETEDVWRLREREAGTSYPERLAGLGWTPVQLRANSGLTLAENGVALASLLGDLVAAWPVPVRRLALVGHSMGGLIVRSACAVSSSAGPWQHLVTDVVTLGTPHLGAPIARALTAGSAGLSLLPESAPFGRFLDHRSAGILDLRDGLPRDVRNLPHARYHLVAGTLARSPRHPVSQVVGDLLVRYPSATGRDRRGAEMFPGADVLHVPGADHFALLNHPDVHRALESWLSLRR